LDYGRPVQFGCFIIPDLLVELTLEHGMDTYIVSGEDAEEMRTFASEVAPAVRAAVAKAR
jgi:hypothetical protein